MKQLAIAALFALAIMTAASASTLPQWFDEKCELQQFLVQEKEAGIPMTWLDSYLYRTCADVVSPLENKPEFQTTYMFTTGMRGDWYQGGFYCGYKYKTPCNTWKTGTFWSGFYTGKPDGTLLYASLNYPTTCTPFDTYWSKFPNVLWTP